MGVNTISWVPMARPKPVLVPVANPKPKVGK